MTPWPPVSDQGPEASSVGHAALGVWWHSDPPAVPPLDAAEVYAAAQEVEPWSAEWPS